MVVHLKQNLTQPQSSVEGPGEGVLEASLACGNSRPGVTGVSQGLVVQVDGRLGRCGLWVEDGCEN